MDDKTTGHWNARARYADGYEIDRDFPYTANGNYEKEDLEQYKYEEFLLQTHNGCVWYSVNYVPE